MTDQTPTSTLEFAQLQHTEAYLHIRFDMLAQQMPVALAQSMLGYMHGSLHAAFLAHVLNSGLRAALFRLTQAQGGYRNAQMIHRKGEPIRYHAARADHLHIERFQPAGSADAAASYVVSSHTGNKGTEPDVVLDTAIGFYTAGPWLDTVQRAANKLPAHRHESPAAFQQFLRHG